MGLRRPLFFAEANDWHSMLLHYAQVAKGDTDSPELVERLDALAEWLETHDECDRRITKSYAIPRRIEQSDLAPELDRERVTYKFLDASTVELTVETRGSKAHLALLLEHAYERSVHAAQHRLCGDSPGAQARG